MTARRLAGIPESVADTILAILQAHMQYYHMHSMILLLNYLVIQYYAHVQ